MNRRLYMPAAEQARQRNRELSRMPLEPMNAQTAIVTAYVYACLGITVVIAAVAWWCW